MKFLKNIRPVTDSDSELIRQYKERGTIELVGQLFQRYMELIYGVCLKYLQDTNAAQDSAMGIFEELVVKLQKHEVDNFKSWLYTLTKNYCLMQLRAGKKQITVKMDEDVMQSADLLHLNGEQDKEEQLKQLEHCLGTLSKEQRQAVELFYLKGKCYQEVAAITGMDWNKVRSHIQNGRRNLKICIEKEKINTEIVIK